MKKILSLTIFIAAFIAASFVAKAQVHYSYTYYDHPYELPVYVNAVVHEHYRDCHMVRARSYYTDNHIAYNLVFSRGNSFVEIFVNHHGHVIKRIHRTYNPVTHVWVSPHHHHYYENGHHHKDHYKKHNHGHYHGNQPGKKVYYSKEDYHKNGKYKSKGRGEVKSYSRRSDSDRKEHTRKSTERYHSYARSN